MDQPHPYRAKIPTLAEGKHRPLWSVMIPTYNCARYLRETLLGVLGQDPGPEVMQIEVVDDHSTQDDPAALVRELGQGRVGFYRQVRNVGHTKNLETCLQRSKGHLIHLLHGDDCVLEGFYHNLQRAFEHHPAIGAAFCRHIFMDEKGHWQGFSMLEQQHSGMLPNWLERIALTQRIQTPSVVVRRRVYEQIGGFDSRLSWAEDWEMWVRIAAHYEFWYEVQPLAAYRMHSGSNTGRYILTGENLKDVLRVIEIIKAYLPESKAAVIPKHSREHWALYGLKLAHQLIARGDTLAARAQIRGALGCSRSFMVVLSLLPLVWAIGGRWARSIVNGRSPLPLMK